MGQTYQVPCDCGQSLAVTSAAAGTVVRCQCGAEVKIPGLSDLRKLAGQEAYVSNAIQKIERAHAAGQEPAGTACLKCQGTPEYWVDLAIIVDLGKIDFVPATSWLMRRYFFFGLIVYGLIHEERYKRHLDLKDHRHARTRFLLCGKCSRQGRKIPASKKVRKLLKRVPVYLELFRENRGSYLKFLGIHPSPVTDATATAVSQPTSNR